MSKKVLIVLAIALLAFTSSTAFALQVDGLQSNTGPALPVAGALETSVNPGGLGDSLIYGYYNVRGNLNIFNVTNTDTTHGLKARVVFRNAKSSHEVLDFSVCLSRGDLFTGYVLDGGSVAVMFDDGAFTSATGITADTITAPAIPTSGALFRALAWPYPNTASATYTVQPDDTKEGYFEIIGLARIPFYDKNASSTVACDSSAVAATNCIRTVAQCEAFQPSTPFFDAQNSLMGNNQIIDMATLTSFGYNATAFADTTDTAFVAATQVEPTVPFAMSSRLSRTVGSACSEFEYLLSKSDVMYTYDLISALGGETEYIFTFPSRLACHLIPSNEVTNLFDGVALSVNNVAQNVYDITKYCTTVTPTITDWKELGVSTSLDFSPRQGQAPFCLPYEANVVKMGASNIWNSTVAISLSNNNFPLGWMNFNLFAGNTTHVSTLDGNTSRGLPALVYATQTLVGGNTGFIAPMAYKTIINGASGL